MRVMLVKVVRSPGPRSSQQLCTPEAQEAISLSASWESKSLRLTFLRDAVSVIGGEVCELLGGNEKMDPVS